MTDLTGRKPILCLDFDGVCHSYTSGWKGADVIPGARVPGLFEFLTEVGTHFEINIFSSRSNQAGGVDAMKEWFINQYCEWHNTGEGGGPCVYKYPSGAICGYARPQCMHEGSASCTVPALGRHAYQPTIIHRDMITKAQATPIVTAMLHFPVEKPPAFVGIDDRVIQFTGEWPSLDSLKSFKSWNAKEV